MIESSESKKKKKQNNRVEPLTSAALSSLRFHVGDVENGWVWEAGLQNEAIFTQYTRSLECLGRKLPRKVEGVKRLVDAARGFPRVFYSFSWGFYGFPGVFCSSHRSFCSKTLENLRRTLKVLDKLENTRLMFKRNSKT